MTTEYLPLCQPSLLPSDHGFSSLDTTCIHHLLSVTLQQITEPIISGFFFSHPVSKIILSHCWWASQTVSEWTRPFVLGVAVGIAPQQGWYWQRSTHSLCIGFICCLLEVCWNLPVGYFLLSLFFLSLPTSLPCPQYRQKVLTMAVVKRVNG